MAERIDDPDIEVVTQIMVDLRTRSQAAGMEPLMLAAREIQSLSEENTKLLEEFILHCDHKWEGHTTPGSAAGPEEHHAVCAHCGADYDSLAGRGLLE